MSSPYHPVRWAAAVTTVPSRRKTLLPRTLESLSRGGFERPRLFVDGIDPRDEIDVYQDVTIHNPPLRSYGNWVIALWELLIRHPEAHRYVIFQDDLVCVSNLRQYLEHLPFPERGYLNLFTNPQNQALIPRDEAPTRQRSQRVGFFPSNQMGRGALGLVFDRAGVTTLLAQPHIVERPLEVAKSWCNIDGAILTAMKKAGYTEYCHNPSLLQHTGQESTLGHPTRTR